MSDLGSAHRTSHRTTDEWERHIGSQVRRLRLRDNVSQTSLAATANVSESTIKNLEAGRGSSLATLIRVARALGRTDWLDELAAPDPTMSPLERLRTARVGEQQVRRRASAGEG
jgi:transcriptional regulator with XRE-family HTH domain